MNYSTLYRYTVLTISSLSLLACSPASGPDNTVEVQAQFQESNRASGEPEAIGGSTLNAMFEESDAIRENSIADRGPGVDPENDEVTIPGGDEGAPDPGPSTGLSTSEPKEKTITINTATCSQVNETQANNLELNPAIMERIFIRYCPLNLPSGAKIIGMKAFTAKMTGADGLGNSNAWNDFTSVTNIREANWDEEKLIHTAYISTDALARRNKWGPCKVQLKKSDTSVQASCDSPPKSANNHFIIEVRDTTPEFDGDEYRSELVSIRTRGRSLTEIIQIQISASGS